MEEWKSIPEFSNYEANLAGQIRNKKTGIVLKTWSKSGKGKDLRRQKVQITGDNGVPRTVSVSRLICAAKVGRFPKDYEHVCHVDGDASNDEMSNLRLSDVVNNAIDEIECGRLLTTLEYVDLAISRLEELRRAMVGSPPSGSLNCHSGVYPGCAVLE